MNPYSIAGDHGLLWLSPRGWIASAGVADTVAIPAGADPADAAHAVAAALADRTTDDGSPALAFAAVPFRPGSAVDVVIPEVVRRGDRLDADRAGGPAPAIGPEGPITVEATVPPAEWCRSVEEATRRIRLGDATKVVLAREVVVTLPEPAPPQVLAQRLHHRFPSCTTFSVDGLVGASPELLVSRGGEVVRSHPLAGTSPRAADRDADARLARELLASEKDRWEHQITIDRVHETLLPFCSYLDAEADPSVVAVANVQHLGTMVEGRLSDPAPSVLELALRLHPTPAVAGEPRAAALALIDELEAGDRGRWAGAVGWVDAAGDGEWMVAIRSAQLHGNQARLWAGNGIVADSDPLAELQETRAKLDAVLPLLIRP